MQRDFAIVTDSSCDLPKEMAMQMELTVVPLQVNLNGDSFPDTKPHVTIHEFYDALRNGAVATTSAPGTQAFVDAITPMLEAKKDILILSFSSALSGACNAARLAAEELREKFPDSSIFQIDTLCASLGQGLLLTHAFRKRIAGWNVQRVAEYIEDTKQHLCHLFTVDDLMFLRRGGRISAATAAFGTLLNIKPFMHMDDGGHLTAIGKVRGRKAALRAMAERMRDTATEPFGEREAYISHGDCEEDAHLLTKMIREIAGAKDVTIGNVGPVIGSHSGPGTLALFFTASGR